MFITTKYKMFESNFSDDDIRLVQEIESQKEFIFNEYELVVKHRQPFGDTVARRSGARYFDISKDISGILSSVGVYDILNREFILFYAEGKYYHTDYIRIKSDNFFDQLERVHYLIFVED